MISSLSLSLSLSLTPSSPQKRKRDRETERQRKREVHHNKRTDGQECNREGKVLLRHRESPLFLSHSRSQS
jgi:hypothetical protein